MKKVFSIINNPQEAGYITFFIYDTEIGKFIKVYKLWLCRPSTRR